MGSKQETLKRMLRDAGYDVSVGKLARPTVDARGVGKATLWTELDRVYRQLGGVLAECPLRVGQWDIEIGNVAIEFDEEQHFNRYRAITLAAPHYGSIPTFPLMDYRLYCERYESKCSAKSSAGAGYWTSASTVKQFGAGSPPGDLHPPGAPRWKQRAFYDFLKDLAPEIAGTRVARISIWDTVLVQGADVLLGDVLHGRDTGDALPAVVALIERRAGERLA